jgi:hypothetical protein
MKDLALYPKVKLETPIVRSDSDEKDEENPFYPFTRVTTVINEVHYCPFCGKEVQDYQCSCDEFKRHFTKLQDTYLDSEHSSKLHGSIINATFGYGSSISKLSIKKLSKHGALILGPDFWDFADRVADSLTKQLYFVGNAIYNKGIVRFFCKNLQTKEVFICDTEKISYTPKPLFLGKKKEKFISRSNRIGDYSRTSEWDDLGKFENWDEFCKILKKCKPSKTPLFS